MGTKNEIGRFKGLTIDEWLKKSSNASIIPIFYSQLIPRLLNKYGNDEQKVKEDLKEFGRRIIIQFFRYWTPKKKDLVGFMKETYRFIQKRRLKRIIEVEKGKKWLVKDTDCLMCWMGIEEFGDIHYCMPMAGIFEGGINHLRVTHPSFLHFPKVRAETIMSRTHGDDFCQHEITVVE